MFCFLSIINIKYMKFRFLSLLIFTFIISLFDLFGFYFSDKQSSPIFEINNVLETQNLTNDLSDNEYTSSLDLKINSFLKKWDIKGATVAVVKDSKLVFAKGFGYANEETRELVNPAHLFRIASVSKLITATTIMKLQEEGLLLLSDKVFGNNGILNNYEQNNFRDKRIKNITVEQLLRHSSGFTSRYGDQMFLPLSTARRMDVLPPAKASTIIEYALTKRLNFMPGSRSSYSNLGYVILEKIIEQVSHQDYESFVKSNILQPAGIFDMHIGSSLRENKYANEVNYYEQYNANKVRSYDGSGKMVSKSNGGNYIEALGGAGAWIASGPELLKLVLAVDGDNSTYDILNAESVKYMTTPSNEGFPPIGWKRTLKDGTWWRTGSLAGTSAILKHQANGFDWVLITNTSSWRGSNFPKNINRMMNKALKTVDKWPETDLFYHIGFNKQEFTLEQLESSDDIYV